MLQADIHNHVSFYLALQMQRETQPPGEDAVRGAALTHSGAGDAGGQFALTAEGPA